MLNVQRKLHCSCWRQGTGQGACQTQMYVKHWLEERYSRVGCRRWMHCRVICAVFDSHPQKVPDHPRLPLLCVLVPSWMQALMDAVRYLQFLMSQTLG